MFNTRVALAAFALLRPVGLMAQEPASASFAGLRAGQMVRVRTHDGNRLEGRVAGIALEPTLLTVRVDAAETSLPLAAVDSLWVRRRHVMQGAMIGGVVLAGVGLVVGSAVCATVDCGPSVVPLAPVAGAAVGGLAGAGIGSLMTSWRLVYQRGGPTALRSADRQLLLGVRLDF